MKRFWQVCMAVVATGAMANAADAQWNDAGQIGSYQSILARAGYGNSQQTSSASGIPVSYNQAQNIPAPPGAAMAAQQMPVQAEGGMMMAGSGNYLDSVSNDVVCDAPVYDPGNSVVSGGNGSWVVGLFGVSYRRDYEDNVRLGCTCGGAGTDIYSRDVENGDMAGGGISFTRRGCNGYGLEAVFWGLDQEDDVTIAGPTQTWLTGLGAVAHPPSGGTVENVYDTGDSVRLYRDTDIFNFEFNLLRNGGEYMTCTGRCANYELLAGFRLFNFDESLRYVSYSSTPGYPATIEYSLEAENSLAGFQIGGRSEVCLTDRWSFAYSGTAGVFNNYIETRQQIFDSNAYSAMDYSDTKNDAAFLGTVDLGLIFQVSQRVRARAGYRALGAAGVALAADQIPYDFTDTTALTSANSNGNLLLYGWYYGGEFCF